MDPRNKLRAKSCVNSPVARQSVHALELLGADGHIKMAFATLGITRMTAVAFAVVNNIQCPWRKSFLQPILNLLSFRHFFVFAPSLFSHAV